MSETTVDDREGGKKATVLKTNLPALIFVQVIIAGLLTSGILYGGFYYCPSIPVPKSNDFVDKLVYTLRCCGYPGAVILMLAVWGVGIKRGSTGAVNPLAGKEKYVQLEKQYLANTLEQLTVFLLLSLTLTTFLEPSEMRLVPLFALVFVIGRILFRIGYGISPFYRGVGIWMQLHSSTFMIGLIGYLMYSRGFLYNLDVAEFASSVAHATGKLEL